MHGNKYMLGSFRVALKCLLTPYVTVSAKTSLVCTKIHFLAQLIAIPNS